MRCDPLKASMLAIAIALPFLGRPLANAATRETVASPDGSTVVSIEIKSKPQPYLPGKRAYYNVSYAGKVLLMDSPLGIDFKGAPPLNQDLTIINSSRESHDTSWNWRFGAESRIRDHYNELTVSLQESRQPSRRLVVVFRVYNDGVAFRYVLPRQKALEKFIISDEETGFYFAHEGTAYALDVGRFNSNYEGEFRQISLGDIQPDSIVALPLTAHLNGGPWFALLEADLTDYAGMYLRGARGVAQGLRCRLSPSPEHMDEAVKGATPMSTPWRLLLISPSAGGLIEASDPAVLNLNQPSQIDDLSWVHPGKAAWDWWSGDYATGVKFTPGMNTATIEHYVDFASGAKMPYMLIDAGWSPDVDGVCSHIVPGQSTVPERDWCVQNDITHWVQQVDLPQILEYAEQRNIKILLWIHWTAAASQMERAFPLFEKWGVAGVKVDFMDEVPDDQATVNLYRRLVATAAQYHLLIDLHGAYKPTGMRRTYPNLLTREGILGLEYNKWSTRDTPRHDVTIPFTRMLAGPMDFTPGCFNNATREQFRPRNIHPMCQGTRAHQLAMYVVFLSPLEMLSDYPEGYLHQPGFEFLKDVPTVWDATRVLDGDPSEYITIARRHGSDWYLGSMTNWSSRNLNVPLGFLGPGKWRAEVFADGPNADQNSQSLSTTTTVVTPGDTLPLHLASGGGAAVIFRPAQ